MGVKMFGKIDINQYGKISSEIPAWAMQTHIEELSEEIDSKERSLARGEVPLDVVPQTREEIRKSRETLEKIIESKPKVSDAERDKLWKIYKETGKKIDDTMFSRSEMKLGLASPHEEARRMKDPIIKIDADMVELCEANSISVSKKGDSAYVSRDQATKAWKLIGYLIGEATNVEVLRRDKATK